MEQERVAVLLGLLGAGATLVVTALPYVFATVPAIQLYYQGGAGGPLLIALFGMIAAIVFLAGSTRRTDPPLAAGIVLVLGAFMLILSLSWALNTNPAIIGGFTENTLFRYHHWALVISSLVVAIAAGWYVRIVL